MTYISHNLPLSKDISKHKKNLQLESSFPNFENNGGLKHQKYLKFNNLVHVY